MKVQQEGRASQQPLIFKHIFFGYGRTEIVFPPSPLLDSRLQRRGEMASLQMAVERSAAWSWTVQAIVWYKSFVWSQIFATEMELGQGAVGIWKDTNMQLFRVQLDPGVDEGLLISRPQKILSNKLGNPANTSSLR
jgi:High-temperature-induced dauer-formation protein